MLPGNAKCSMTSVADTRHTFVERFMYGASNLQPTEDRKPAHDEPAPAIFLTDDIY